MTAVGHGLIGALFTLIGACPVVGRSGVSTISDDASSPR